MSWKSDFRKEFKINLVIIGLILGAAGCFLLATRLFGGLATEEFLESSTLKWGFRILVIGVGAISFWKREWLAQAWQRRRFRFGLYMFYSVGFIGWLWTVIDLLA